MKAALGVIVVIIIALGVWVSLHFGQTAPTSLGAPVASAMYSCDAGKTIAAQYYKGTDKPAVGDQPPVPGGSVKLALSDGRTLTLKQTISADGTRYSDGDPQKKQGEAGAESFVFWSKGNGALVLENNEQKSYIGCVSVAKDPGNLPQVYSSGQQGFSVRYPAGYTLDQNYNYTNLGPGKNIVGTKFTIDQKLATGTNLSQDSYVSVEEIAGASQCSASMFLDTANGAKAAELKDDDMTYSFASSTGAGAGNRYEEYVYAILGTSPCVAVRYFVHYGAIGNYPEGAVKEFDRGALISQFDAIRHALTIAQ